MTTYHVIQPNLSDEMIDKVNREDWGAAPLYASAICGRLTHVGYAFLLADGMMGHGWTIETEILEDVFAVGNGIDTGGLRHARGKSVSVGDVAVWFADGQWHGSVCASVGWESVPTLLAGRMARAFDLKEVC